MTRGENTRVARARMRATSADSARRASRPSPPKCRVIQIFESDDDELELRFVLTTYEMRDAVGVHDLRAADLLVRLIHVASEHLFVQSLIGVRDES